MRGRTSALRVEVVACSIPVQRGGGRAAGAASTSCACKMLSTALHASEASFGPGEAIADSQSHYVHTMHVAGRYSNIVS